jgi:hypothetical protein
MRCTPHQRFPSSGKTLAWQIGDESLVWATGRAHYHRDRRVRRSGSYLATETRGTLLPDLRRG